jgi:23S rRNA (cytidine1920-2'-O)/16S rRNA (cytidine1409-2'-O)-methyltransferase
VEPNKLRLDRQMLRHQLVASRSQAESFIKLGLVTVNGKVVAKSGTMTSETDTIRLLASQQFVSRAGLKLASVARSLKLNFKDKTVLDVGSSTGGFTDYALQHGARKVIAIEVGTDQLHPSLRTNPRIELHEKTDIREVSALSSPVDIVVIDVSFVSLRQILPNVSRLSTKQTMIVAMVKPQFEAAQSVVKHKGVIKNDKLRRQILKDFELWAQKLFVIIDKADSDVAGAKGNVERFYLLRNL